MKTAEVYTSDNVFLATDNKTGKSINIMAKNKNTAFEIAEDTFNHLDFNLKELI